MNFKNIVERIQNRIFYFIIFVVFVLFVGFTVWGENGILRLLEVNRIKSKVVFENTELLKQNLLFVQEVTRLKEVQFMEQRARTDLGFIKNNEKVFVLDETEL